MEASLRRLCRLYLIAPILLVGCSAGTLQAPTLATSIAEPGSALVTPPGQLWRYPGVPYPTDANARLAARAGYKPWPFDPFAIVPPLPAAWPTNEQENAYFVNPDHPNATDVGNSWGYPERPRRSPPADGRFGPGTLIQLEGRFADSAPGYREDL